jgi:hypothetical protein
MVTCSVRTSCWVIEITWVPAPGMLKLIVSAPGVRSACSTAHGSEPVVDVEALVFVTVNTAGTSRASRGCRRGVNRGARANRRGRGRAAENDISCSLVR